MCASVQQVIPLLSPYQTMKEKQWNRLPPWVLEIKEKGKIQFESLGIPSTGDEDWKYTDVSGMLDTVFSVPFLEENQLFPGNGHLDEILSRQGFPTRLVFVNGYYNSWLSSLDGMKGNIIVDSLNSAMKSGVNGVKQHLARHVNWNNNSFVALNNAFLNDGTYVHVPVGTNLENPVQLVYINTGNDIAKAVYPRNLVIMDKDSAVTIVEEYVGYGDKTCLTNVVTEIFMDEGSKVEHYKIQRESKTTYHLSTLQVMQTNHCHFVSNSIMLGARLTRNNIFSKLDGEGASCIMNGLYLVGDDRHVDNNTFIGHYNQECESNELFHGILDGNGKGVFTGKIYVGKNAQQTNSQQVNRSLLLSRNAVSDSKPQLEIFADDVKCSHAATVGQLDKDSLYYMRARGVDLETATQMLTLAFARQVMEKFNNVTVMEIVEDMVSKLLNRPVHEIPSQEC